MMQAKNLLEYLLQNIADNPHKQFLHYKNSPESKTYIGLNYQQVFDRVVSLAVSLQRLGIKENDKVALFSFNRPQWVISDLAILAIKAVNVPLYPALSATKAEEILIASNSKIVILDTPKMLSDIQSIKDKCPSLEKVICITNQPLSTEYILFDTLVSYTNTKAQQNEFIEQVKGIPRSQLASIVYTSGTTGAPKGVMLSHGNFIANLTDVLDAVTIYPTDSALSFLPLAHVFERTIGYYCILAIGGSIYYAGNVTTVKDDMSLAHPSIFVGVPLLYERIRNAILLQVKGIKKPLFRWAQAIGKKYYIQQKRSILLTLQYKLANQLVYGKLRKKFGNNIRMFICGGAPLSATTNLFFESLGFAVIEGYGLTETAPVISCNRLEKRKAGSIGLALDSQEIKLAKDGELLVKGPNLMQGYYQEPEQTAQAIDENGWFHTGDIARIDSDQFIYIVDRKKELLVLANGKNVAPSAIEGLLVEDPYITQAFVCGNNQPKIAALIVPNIELLTQKFNINLADASKNWLYNEAIKNFYANIVQDLCSALSSYEQIRHFELIANEFSLETGELTPTLKMKRKFIEDKYADKIAYMYQQIALNKENCSPNK